MNLPLLEPPGGTVGRKTMHEPIWVNDLQCVPHIYHNYNIDQACHGPSHGHCNATLRMFLKQETPDSLQQLTPRIPRHMAYIGVGFWKIIGIFPRF
jgi:hypothetical protein